MLMKLCTLQAGFLDNFAS